MINILLADDHQLVRKGIKQILNEVPDMRVVAEASNGLEILPLMHNTRLDVLLLDISMPLKNGLEILPVLKAEQPMLPVLVLSMYPEEQYAVRCLKEGASGYITKESAPVELICAIRRVYSGGRYVSNSLAENLAFALETRSKKKMHETLSNREYLVMSLIASGKRISDIAEELSLSPKTVSTYRSRLLKKMNMKNNAELTHYAITTKLIG